MDGRGWDLRDLSAGVAVGLVLVPQSLAYAELAGLAPAAGLAAAVAAPLAAAPFVSSPFLQTGPTALVSLLTLGALAPLPPETRPAAAALLALVVGLLRVGLGLARAGGLAFFMSQPVLRGFTAGAGVLIVASQLPAVLGQPRPSGHLLVAAARAGLEPTAWGIGALGFAALTALLLLGGGRLWPRVPWVLLAVAASLVLVPVVGFDGDVVGTVASPFASWPPALAWGRLPSLLIAGAVIAVVGFAEPTAIARTLARPGERRWDADRELLSQGVANLAAGAAGAFPVGGSFSRSSLAKLAGARTRWAGLAAGATALALLPLAGLLETLPRAVLAAIVVVAAAPLADPRPLLRLWRIARLQALTALGTFALTLALAPRVDLAVLVGVALAVAAHLYRETQVGIELERDGGTLRVRLAGVLWFGALRSVEEAFGAVGLDAPGLRRLEVDAGRVGRMDVSGALLVAELLQRARRAGVEAEVVGLQPHMRRVLERVERTRPGAP